MTTEELIEKLQQYPGKQVKVMGRYDEDLDDCQADLAIDHWPTAVQQGVFRHPRTWRWVSEEGETEGKEVVVIYG